MHVVFGLADTRPGDLNALSGGIYERRTHDIQCTCNRLERAYAMSFPPCNPSTSIARHGVLHDSRFRLKRHTVAIDWEYTHDPRSKAAAVPVGVPCVSPRRRGAPIFGRAASDGPWARRAKQKTRKTNQSTCLRLIRFTGVAATTLL